VARGRILAFSTVLLRRLYNYRIAVQVCDFYVVNSVFHGGCMRRWVSFGKMRILNSRVLNGTNSLEECQQGCANYTGCSGVTWNLTESSMTTWELPAPRCKMSGWWDEGIMYVFDDEYDAVYYRVIGKCINSSKRRSSNLYLYIYLKEMHTLM